MQVGPNVFGKRLIKLNEQAKQPNAAEAQAAMFRV